MGGEGHGLPRAVRLVLLLRAYLVASLELDLCDAEPTSEPPRPRVRPHYQTPGKLLHLGYSISVFYFTEAKKVEKCGNLNYVRGSQGTDNLYEAIPLPARNAEGPADGAFARPASKADNLDGYYTGVCRAFIEIKAIHAPGSDGLGLRNMRWALLQFSRIGSFMSGKRGPSKTRPFHTSCVPQ